MDHIVSYYVIPALWPVVTITGSGYVSSALLFQVECNLPKIFFLKMPVTAGLIRNCATAQLGTKSIITNLYITLTLLQSVKQ